MPIGDKQKVKLTTKSTLEKYAPGVSKEDIDSGKAEPYEVIVVEDEIEISEDQAIALGFDPSKIKKISKEGGK